MCGDEIAVWSERAKHTNKGKTKTNTQKKKWKPDIKKALKKYFHSEFQICALWTF